MNQTFPKSARLLKSAEFRHVYDHGSYAADGVLVVNVAPSDHESARLGVVVSKKVGNAVVRQRWKRVLRDAFRTQKHLLPAGWDIVVRPRRGSTCDTPEVRRSIARLTQKACRKFQAANK